MLARARLISGLVLFAFVTTHLLNHALGLLSVDDMEGGAAVFKAVWRNVVGQVALYGALLTHFVLVLLSLYRRRDLRMPVREWLQVGLGLALPILVAEHVLATRGVDLFHGVEDTYTYVLLSLWVFAPEKGVVQAVMVLVAWVHGCLGLYAWLRLKPWFRAWEGVLYAGAILVPVLGLVGFVDGGKQVTRLAGNPDWVEAALAEANLPNPEALAFVQQGTDGVLLVALAAVATVLAAREARRITERRRGVVRLVYPGRREITISVGPTVLETSRRFGIPHASVCGGRGRCSTCRIRVGRGLRELPPASAEEEQVLRRIGAPPNVRLACQTRPIADLEVTPLLPADAGAERGHSGAAYRGGSEREIAILFADLRGFTNFAEQKLPYDVVFVLNRYFATMGAVVERTGGHLDKFIGDGVMALFGLDVGMQQGCRQALAAARGMGEELEHLNVSLASDLEAPLRLGIGIHAGPAIVGEMGYGKTMTITAVGDAVNTASRLETMTKDFGAQLVVSEDAAAAAGMDLSGYPSQEVAVRGRREPLVVRVVADAARLPGTGA